MKLGIVHLSDVHFTSGQNQVLNRAQALAGAVRAADPNCTAYIFLVSGDVANSGKPEEYEEAKCYFQAISDTLTSSLKGVSRPHFCFIPGNHDCDLDADSDTRQMAIGYLASKLDNLDPNGDIVTKCLAVQEQFLSFCSRI